MADLSALGGLQDVEAMDLNDGIYADVKENTFRLPAAGKYTLRTTENFPPASFGRTKAGALAVQIDPTIVGPTNENFTVRFVKVSAKQFERNGQRVSQLGDYLRAVGFRGTLKDEQAQADAVESTAGAIFEALIDWRAYNKDTGFSLEGMTRFPKLEDGTYQSWVADPVAKDENGNPVKVRANLNVQKYLPKTE